MWKDLTTTERLRLLTAVHEAGHSVAATVLGGRIAGAVIIDPPDRDITGKTAFRELPEGVAPSVYFAGPWAEARWLAGKRPTQAEVWAVLDSRGSRDHAELLASGGTAAAAHVVPLIERCWGAVITVARQLNRTGDARHADVCEALGLTDGGGPGSIELAMIRSGCAPGTFTVTRAPAA